MGLRKILKLIPSFSNNLILPLKEIKSSYFTILDKRENLKFQVVLSNNTTPIAHPPAFASTRHRHLPPTNKQTNCQQQKKHEERNN